jgi:hypothetical protein
MRETFDFGWALQMLKAGWAVKRRAWAHEGRHLQLEHGRNLVEVPRQEYPQTGVLPRGWSPTYDDLLADDWLRHDRGEKPGEIDCTGTMR